MEVETALRKRRSIRSFLDKPVPDEIVNDILELANLAPSAGNTQARDFVVVRDIDVKTKLSAAALDQGFVKEAPVLIVVCANRKRSSAAYGKRGKDFYSLQDADAAVMHILLSAHARGLGTCWVGAFDDHRVASVLRLPEYIRPIAIIPLGYPAKVPETTSRIGLDELVHQEQW